MEGHERSDVAPRRCAAQRHEPVSSSNPWRRRWGVDDKAPQGEW